MTLITLRTGFTTSTCIKERPETTMTTVQWMTTGSWADLKYNQLSKAGQTRYSDCNKVHCLLCNVNLVSFL